MKRFEERAPRSPRPRPGFADPIWAADQYLWAGAANRAYPRLAEMRDKMDPGFVQAVEMMAERTLFDASKARLVRLELAATMGRFFQRLRPAADPDDGRHGVRAGPHARSRTSRRWAGARSPTRST